MDRYMMKTIMLLMSVLEASNKEVLIDRVNSRFILFVLDGEKFILDSKELHMKDPVNTVEDLVPLLELI